MTSLTLSTFEAQLGGYAEASARYAAGDLPGTVVALREAHAEASLISHAIQLTLERELARLSAALGGWNDDDAVAALCIYAG